MIRPLGRWTPRSSRTCWNTFLPRSCSIVCTPRSGRVRRSWHTPVSGPWRVTRRVSQPRKGALEKGEGKGLSLLQGRGKRLPSLSCQYTQNLWQRACVRRGTVPHLERRTCKGAYYATDYPV